MILRDFHEILQKFQSLDEADLVDNKIGNQEECQEDQQTEEMVVSEDVGAAQSEEELLQRTEEYDEIDVVEQHLDEDLDGGELLDEDLDVEQHLDEDLDGGEHLEVTKHLTEGDGGDYPSDSGKSDENKHREDILQKKEREGEQDLNKYEDELKEEREIEADRTKPVGSSIIEKPRENEGRAREDEIDIKATKENENGEKDSLCDQLGEEVKPSKSGWTSPHAHLEQMFKNQEELERAVDQTSKATEESSKAKAKKTVRADKEVTMQQVIRAFSAVRNLKKICRLKSKIAHLSRPWSNG